MSVRHKRKDAISVQIQTCVTCFNRVFQSLPFQLVLKRARERTLLSIRINQMRKWQDKCKIKFAYRPEVVSSLSETVVSFRFLAFYNSSRDCELKNARSLVESHCSSSRFVGWNLCNNYYKIFPIIFYWREIQRRIGLVDLNSEDEDLFMKKVFVFPIARGNFHKIDKDLFTVWKYSKNYTENVCIHF